ncbi:MULTISPECIES: phage tail protein [Brevibacillus]|uniref:phage tail protein n=1 Tax=Brevibacillus TaxID=55080 RepID=UPI0007ABE2DB|nr:MULTISPECIES: tail fiber protein [Brevibacillus]KZE43355.1 phage tail protein [Brevibacillus parabrevis]UED69812.1 tail fiber protein [Brevibacillus sp. HD3.3A]
MSEPFLGEIRLFANNYAPRGWMFCEGQILNINQNQALYSLLGAVYGGDGVTTFALPDYRGRTPIHVSSTIPLGTAQGEANHTLTINEMPQHTHQVAGSSLEPTASTAANNVWAAVANAYGPAANLQQMNANTMSTAGGSQPHNNMQPYLVMNYAIAIQGIYPSRN